MPSITERFYPEARFGGFTDIDGTVAFYNRVHSLIDASSVILDLGCGRGVHGDDPAPLRRDLRILKGKVAKVIGIDVDEDARGNPYIDEFHLIEGDAWPVESDSIDLIICNNVIEHIDDPDRFFAEINRILRNGGCLCVRTPNRWSYVALAARLFPNKFHPKITSAVQEGRHMENVFPTMYRCNTARKLRRMMKKHGIDGIAYGHSAEPSYLTFSAIAYFLGVVHQRLAPGFIKPALFAFGRIDKNVG